MGWDRNIIGVHAVICLKGSKKFNPEHFHVHLIKGRLPDYPRAIWRMSGLVIESNHQKITFLFEGYKKTDVNALRAWVIGYYKKHYFRPHNPLLKVEVYGNGELLPKEVQNAKEKSEEESGQKEKTILDKVKDSFQKKEDSQEKESGEKEVAKKEGEVE